jgi:zinc/manganese transport system substrate-binding protein
VRRLLIPLATALVLAACGTLSACGTAPTPNGLQVVAAENFWGSIARQLAGTQASVHSIIVNPGEDPHDYEPTAGDARALATARLVIANGIGYDPWVQRLVKANPVSGRTLLSVGDLFGLKEGDNPHRWYEPAEVEQVAAAITSDLQRLDPRHAAYYAQQKTGFETTDLAGYHQLIAAIRRRYAGTPVGASESIFALMAPSLGLELITPPGFMKAISEGTDVTARDTVTAQRQISDHRIKVWIYNSQNATPAIQRLNELARTNHIPIATVTETLTPAGASFEQWQVGQLQRLERALHQATGR